MLDRNTAVLLSMGKLINVIFLTSTNSIFLALEHVWLDLRLLVVLI